MKPVWYEPHPVTPERKAELQAQGYRIIDARFAPDDWCNEPEEVAAFIEDANNAIVAEVDPAEALKPRRGRKKKVI